MANYSLSSTSAFTNKNILLGVTGGIAAYKAAELTRLLVKQGANVQVVMTESASFFIRDLTFQALTGNSVRTSLFDATAELGMGHIELARWSDFIIIAPATANIIAKLAHGFANDLLSTVCLAQSPKKTKIYIAPAMNTHMLENSRVQHNISVLKQDNYHILDTTYGEQACGDVGYGRMLDPQAIIDAIATDIKQVDNQNTKRLLITAGPTIEAIDPVRYISNHSSGKMGYSLALAASRLGYSVTLISGPVDSDLIKKLPSSIKLIQITSANSMSSAVQNNINQSDIFISVAAVADYKPKQLSNRKIKKTEDKFDLELTKNVDILKQVGELKKSQNKKLFIVGFAAETENYLENAKVKLINKNLDLIILNQIDDQSIGFNSDYNAVKVIDRDNNINVFARQPKQELALKLIEFINSSYDKIA